jgi:hypothetical protein
LIKFYDQISAEGKKSMRIETKVLIGILTAIVLSINPAQSSAQDTITIDKFISQSRNSENSSNGQFVGFRCTSLYMTMSVYLEGDQLRKFSWEWSQAMQNAMFSTVFLSSEESSSTEYMTGQIEIMNNLYQNLFIAEREKTGNGFNNKIIKSDLKTCGKIFIRRN